MSGHSKWATIKRKKAAVDAQRGKMFTKIIRELMTAARKGGGDPESNPRLRTAITAARGVNMPRENIERAIKRGTGEIEGQTFEEMSYEGYGPGGVALLIDTLSDNKNRTVGEIRHILTKNHGSMGESGCVAWMFTLRGMIAVPAAGKDEEAIMDLVVESGAEDFSLAGDVYQIMTQPGDLFSVRDALEKKGVEITSAELIRIPSNTVTLTGKDAEAMIRLLEALEDHDDVQRVSANFDIADELMESLGG
jgi:YebC/PmpR family DNA-binding regulatory protein